MKSATAPNFPSWQLSLRVGLAGVAALGLALVANAAWQQAGTPASSTPGGQASATNQAPGTANTRPKQLKTRSDLSKLKLETRQAAAPVVAGGQGATDPGFGPPAPGSTDSGVPVEQSGPVGELTVPEASATVDFGDLIQGAVKTSEVELVNSGVGPLKISAARASCGCTTTRLMRVAADGTRSDYVNDSEIAPGEKFVVEFGVNTEGKQGNWEGNVTIFSNDPSRTDLIKLKANIKPFFVLTPSPYLNFEKLFVSDQATRRLTVTSPVVERFALAVSATNSLPEYLKITLEPKDPIEGRAASWDVVATLGPNAPEMPSNNWPVIVESDVAIEGALAMPDGTVRKHQINIYTIANVVGMVTVEPNYLSFGIVPPGAEREKVAVIKIHDASFKLGDVPVSVRGQTEQMNAVLSKHSSASLGVNEAGEPIVKLKISGLPEEFAGPFGGYLDIDVGHPSKAQVSVPFTGVCRETVVRPATPPAANPATPPAASGAAPAAGSPAPAQGGGLR
jgi:Protein of unknown function (DUF1573)